MADVTYYTNKTPIVEFLKEAGGNYNIIGNYSVNPTVFKNGPAPHMLWFIDFVKVQITDNGLFFRDRYGNVSALPNGFTIKIKKKDKIYPLTPDPIQYNDQFIHYSFDYQIIAFAANVYTTSAILKFETPFILEGDKGDLVRCRMRDDLSGLTDHTITFHGIEMPIRA